MTERRNPNRPLVAIGGMGGSGTRLIARILVECGIYMGSDLNEALDNLVFTRLFKDPVWFRNADKEDIYKRLELFNKHMTGQSFDFYDLKKSFSSFRKNRNYPTQKMYYLKFLINHLKERSSFNRWGWKEPNTHLYIKHLAHYYKDLKYIHVVRNGLDMAFSNNRKQLWSWGFLYDIDISAGNKPIHSFQLDYWIRSNLSAISSAKYSFGPQLYILNFDKLCMNKPTELSKLLSFLNINIDKLQLEKLAKLIRQPESINRAKEKDLSIFTNKQIKEVEKMGFDLSDFNISSSTGS